MATTSLQATPELRQYNMLIRGEWVAAWSGKTFETINPFTGAPWAVVPEAGPGDVDDAVRAARAAFDAGPWSTMTGSERAELIRRFADLVAGKAEELAEIETTDNGKLLREMRGQLGVLPKWYHYFAGAADKLRGATIPTEKANFFTYTRREPVGVVAIIVPWNSPLLLLSMKLAPALAAGCTVVIKPAEQTPASTLECARLFAEAGFPPGVVNVVTGFGPTTGRALVRHPMINKVSFTGSTETGIVVLKDSADQLTRVTLELGGKSPNIVFDDADVEAAANGVVSGIFAATGQTCVAGSRLLVHRAVEDDLVHAVVARARAIKLGDPRDEATEMGPVAFEEQLAKVLTYINIGIDGGARIACGGERSMDERLSRGYFVDPTVLTGVTNDMRVAQEEIFGPVLSVIPFSSEDEAISLANDTRYGLAAGIWTNDVRRAHRVAHAVKAGTIWVNSYRTLSPAAPFGGFGESGIGRENGFEGLDAFTETKAVWIELAGETRDPFRLG